MNSTLESRLTALGIINAETYAKKFEEDEWDWDGLVSLNEDALDGLVRKVGMKEGSEFKFKQCVKEERAKLGGSVFSSSALSAPLLEDQTSGVRVSGAAARESDGGRAFAEGCRWLYGYGEGVNYHEAVAYLKRGAELKHPMAAAHLASCLMEGKGCRNAGRSTELEATMWAMRSVDSLGLQHLADAGDASAKLALGLLLNAGIGQEMNQGAAIAHFRKAAMAGDPVAMNLLAGMIEEGHCVVDEQEATAADWYRKAAEAGVVQAQSNFGLMLMKGKGVPKDERAAVDWFVRAAEQGDPDVQNWLGLCYQDGRCGVAPDDAEAARWYTAAAESGDPDAMSWLGTLYKEGRGVPKDDARALEYFMAAANAGCQSALDELRNRGLSP